MRTTPYAVALILMLACLAGSGQGRELTLEQAVNEALANNQDYLMARAELERAQAEIQRATAEALPDLSFSSSYTRNLEIPEVVFGGMSFKLGTDNSISAGLTLKQPIWQGGKVAGAIKIARLYRRYTEAAVQETEAEIKFAVRQSFLNAILAQDVVAVYRDALATAELNHEMIAKMQAQGVVSEYEKLRAEVEVANLKPQLLQAQNQATLALNALENLIAADRREEVTLRYDFDSTLAQQSYRFDQLLEVALARRAALQRQERLAEITQRAIGIAKAERSPKFDFVSHYGWSYQSDDFGLEGYKWSPSWTATINLSFPIFNGFSTKAGIRKAKVDNLQAELSYEKLRDQVELQVRDAFLSYNEATERLQTQIKTIEQAEEGLRIARIRYQNGVGTQLEILSSETALTQARTNYVQATHDAALAVYRLLRVTGVNQINELKEQ